MGFSDCAVCQSFNVARISRTTESLGLSVRISKMKKLVTTSCGDLDSILLDVGKKLSRGQVVKDSPISSDWSNCGCGVDFISRSSRSWAMR